MSNPWAAPEALEPPSPQGPGLAHTLFALRGRVPRRTYWLWTLASWPVGYVALAVVARVTGRDDVTTLFFQVGLLAIAWIHVALTVKRLHDRDMSGWYVLLYLVPFGSLVLWVQCGVRRGTRGPNRYGPDPT